MTKYLRQQATARRLIVKYGTTCTWYKEANTDTSDDDSPEFPTADAPIAHTDVPIVFYPQRNLRFVTSERIVATGQVSNDLYALLPGDVDFTPDIGDTLDCAGQTMTVKTVNTTNPDLSTPVCHELSFVS